MSESALRHGPRQPLGPGPFLQARPPAYDGVQRRQTFWPSASQAHGSLNDPLPATLASAAIPLSFLSEPELAVLALLSLFACGFFALLRVALVHSVPSRVLEGARSEAERARLRPRLERVEALSTSASVLGITSEIAFAMVVLALVGGERLTWGTMLVSLSISVPLLAFVGEVLPHALRGERTDGLLRSVLYPFDLLQRPLGWLIVGLDGGRSALMRLLRIPERPPAARRIVEDLRDVVEDSDRQGDLRETEREIIENVVDLSGTDVAELMTPRTELRAVELGAGTAAVLSEMASSGFSRIPVYEGSLDNIVGVAYAQEMLALVSSGELEDKELKSLLRPVGFVPETKLVTELLAQFRRDKQKMVVVLDEYGGTAGLVTLGDVLTELVGEMRQELGESAPAAIRRNEDGSIEVLGGTHVSDVNEELDLDLPEEEDYETLAGFVLAQLGRFPRTGESFRWKGHDFKITEASDRRVLGVRLRPALAKRA